jgi:hypothetical protein
MLVMGSILSMQWPVTEPRLPAPRRTPAAVLFIAGVLHELRGRISVWRGTVFHNDLLRARGHRQQLVGMLQRLWKRDRRSVELWVDTLLRRSTPVAMPKATTPSGRWVRPLGVPSLHREP